MKKILFLAFACSFVFVSCNNDLEQLNTDGTSKLQTKSVDLSADFGVVNYDGEPCLRFKDYSSYAKIYEKIAMSEENAETLFSGLGFISQSQLMKEADKEQEAIVDNYEKDLTQPWPYKQIKEFKDKYRDVFIFNPYDSTDFIANYKLKISSHRDFANRKGVFLIGDSVVVSPNYTLEEFFGSPVSAYGDNEATNTESINEAESKYQIPGGDYVKIRLRLRWDDEINNVKFITLDYLSQKKKVVWKKHNATIYAHITGKEASGNFWGIRINNKIENYHGKTFKVQENVYDEERQVFSYVGQNPRSNFPLTTPVKYKYRFTGTYEIFSNEIPESHKGMATADLGVEW